MEYILARENPSEKITEMPENISQKDKARTQQVVAEVLILMNKDAAGSIPADASGVQLMYWAALQEMGSPKIQAEMEKSFGEALKKIAQGEKYEAPTPTPQSGQRGLRGFFSSLKQKII